MKERKFKELAHEVCNGEIIPNTIETYPELYNIAWNYIYAHITIKQIKYFETMQWVNSAVCGYVPMSLYDVIEKLIKDK